MTSPHRWRKSSYSNEEGACVELSHTLEAVRDSKDPDGPTLGVGLRGLLAGDQGWSAARVKSNVAVLSNGTIRESLTPNTASDSRYSSPSAKMCVIKVR